jgi:hypothetical protein
VIRSDEDGEYNSPFDEFYSEYGIIHQIMASYSL